MKTLHAIAMCGLLAALALPSSAQTPLGTEFTYQGQLKGTGGPANGLHDLRFRLYDALAGGARVGVVVCADDVSVTDGLFTVPLDFGAQFAGDERFLEIEVRTDTGLDCTNPAGFTTLAPRQPITAAPYALQTRGIFVDEDAKVGIGTLAPNYPLHVETDSLSRAIYGRHTATSGTTYGVYGQSDSTDGGGVFGFASATSGTTHGVWGRSASTSGRAVFGQAYATSGVTYGGHFESASTSGRGVFGWARAASGANYGVYGLSNSTAGRGVYGRVTALSGTNYGVRGQTSSPSGFDFYASGAGTNYGATSSIRWKSNVEPIDRPLEKIARLRGVYFDWDAEHGGHHDVGMIAEEVGKVLPEIVNYEENGTDAIGLDYSKMTPLLVEALNALRTEKDAQITALREDIDDLRAANMALESRMAQLEAALARITTPMIAPQGNQQ